MNNRIVWLTAVSFALAAAAHAAEQGAAGASQTETPEVPATEHQGEALEAVEDEFAALDSDGDGYISKEEAQGSPELAGYWEENELGDEEKMDRSDFARFEAKAIGGEAAGEAAPETELPASEHQEEAVEGAPEQQ